MSHARAVSRRSGAVGLRALLIVAAGTIDGCGPDAARVHVDLAGYGGNSDGDVNDLAIPGPPSTDAAGNPGFNRDAACAKVSAMATLGKKPVDIVFVIDNSGSMTDKIVAVQNNINGNFAQIIAASGLDYRVILISRHGNALLQQSVCISSPLSGTNCNPIPNQPANTKTFFQYSVEIGSNNEFQKMLDTYLVPDEFNLAPNGWAGWLRDDSLKVVVVITDDNSDKPYMQFETELFALKPTRFGDAMSPNFIWHSIIGLKENNPANQPYAPMDPIVNSKCNTNLFFPAPGPGVDYQQLSKLTGGLRFPICQTMSYDSVFKAAAMSVVAGAKVSCDFPIPAAPMGQNIDLATVVIEYTDGAGKTQDFMQVADANACAPGKFYIDKVKRQIFLCADACKTVQADPKAKVSVLFDCEVPLM